MESVDTFSACQRGDTSDGRVMMGDTLFNILSSEGFLPRYVGTEEICLIGQDGQFNILNDEGLSRLKIYQFNERWETQKLWSSTPATVYKEISVILGGLCRSWKIFVAKHNVSVHSVSDVEIPPESIVRFNLSRDLWWCANPSCVVCNRLTEGILEEAVRYGDAFIRLSEYIYIHNLWREIYRATTLGDPE